MTGTVDAVLRGLVEHRLGVLLPGGRIEGRNDIRINGIGGVGTGASFFGVLLEGQDQTMPLGPGNSDMHAPSVEAVQEISVQTSNFSAEYGQAGSGLFNFTTKSGTNQIHGSAYEYLVNEALHAGRPYTNDGNGNLVKKIKPDGSKTIYPSTTPRKAAAPLRAGVGGSTKWTRTPVGR